MRLGMIWRDIKLLFIHLNSFFIISKRPIYLAKLKICLFMDRVKLYTFKQMLFGYFFIFQFQIGSSQQKVALINLGVIMSFIYLQHFYCFLKIFQFYQAFSFTQNWNSKMRIGLDAFLKALKSKFILTLIYKVSSLKAQCSNVVWLLIQNVLHNFFTFLIILLYKIACSQKKTGINVVWVEIKRFLCMLYHLLVIAILYADEAKHLICFAIIRLDQCYFSVKLLGFLQISLVMVSHGQSKENIGVLLVFFTHLFVPQLLLIKFIFNQKAETQQVVARNVSIAKFLIEPLQNFAIITAFLFFFASQSYGLCQLLRVVLEDNFASCNASCDGLLFELGDSLFQNITLKTMQLIFPLPQSQSNIQLLLIMIFWIILLVSSQNLPLILSCPILILIGDFNSMVKEPKF